MSIGIPNTHTHTRNMQSLYPISIHCNNVLQSFIAIFVCIGGRDRDFLEPGFRSPSLEGQGMMTKIS